MPKRPSKRPRDVNQLAHTIMREATGDVPTTEPVDAEPKKNPAAVALGKLGGSKGGKAHRSQSGKPSPGRLLRASDDARSWQSVPCQGAMD